MKVDVLVKTGSCTPNSKTSDNVWVEAESVPAGTGAEGVEDGVEDGGVV